MVEYIFKNRVKEEKIDLNVLFMRINLNLIHRTHEGINLRGKKMN